MKYSTKLKFLQGVGAIVAAGCVIGCSIHSDAESSGGFEATFEGDTPVAVGQLVIPGKAASSAVASIGREEIFRMKMERWKANHAVEETDEEIAETVEPWYTERDLELVACTVYCEAGSDSISDETRMMVAQVIINRVNDERFPNTIEEVLTQRSQYGRFYWTGVVWPARAAHEPEAVERAYECARRVLDGEWLLPSDVVFQAEFVQGEIVVHVPGFYFCR